MAVEEDVLSQTAQAMRVLSRSVRSRLDRLRRLTGSQRTRSLLEEALQGQRNDPELDRSLGGMDPRERTQAFERLQDLEVEIEGERAKRERLQGELHNQADRQRDDRDGDRVPGDVEDLREAEDETRRREDQAKDRDRDIDQDGDGVADVVEDEQADRDREAEERRQQDRERDREEQERAERGPDAAVPVAAAAGAAAAVDELNDQRDEGADELNGPEAESEQDIEVGDDGVIRPAGEQAQQEELTGPEGEQAQQQELSEPEANQARQEELTDPEAEQVRQEELADPEAEQVRQEELAGPEVGEQGQDPSPYVNDDLSVDERAVDGQDAGLQHDVDNDLGQDGQFVNADGSVDQEALNGQDAGLEQGDGGPEPGLPTAGDRQLSNEIAEQNAPNDPQQPVEKVLAKAREQNGGPGSHQPGNNPMSPDEISHNTDLYAKGTAPAALAAQQSNGAAVATGHAGKSPADQHRATVNRSGRDVPGVGE